MVLRGLELVCGRVYKSLELGVRENLRYVSKNNATSWWKSRRDVVSGGSAHEWDKDYWELD